MKSNDCLPALKALADPTRLRLVDILLTKPHTVNDLAEALKTPQYNISKHLRILREAGLVEGEVDGQHREYTVPQSLREKLRDGGKALELGCCTFRFDRTA
jgi:DNA-binding transcriptional ArsR family regulator